VDENARFMPKVLQLYLEVSQYPILASRIRERMRQELFARGVIAPDRFESEAREKAVLSQQREGLSDPVVQESAEMWQERLRQVRDTLTDFYFAYNLPHDLFRRILTEVLGPQRLQDDDILTFNPELAPWDILFAKGEEYEALPPERRGRVRHHLQEIIVVLLKAMISDHLQFIGLARELFTMQDLKYIRQRRIGRGKIGGKAAGMLLAWKILQMDDSDTALQLRPQISIPESFFVGADVFYDFHAYNHLMEYVNQKYKPQEEIEQAYPHIYSVYRQGRFPPEIAGELHRLLEQIGTEPIIVRSSSLLEDNFGTSFAGKYESHFCANQGTLDENLSALTDAITRIYASVVNPAALLYRKQMGLLDYDERMAILIQTVQGERYGHWFFPTAAGVAFSRNPFRWNPRIRREVGLVRMVCGLGTRAVDRVPNDYPRMVALSHPTLRPEVNADDIRRYSQHFIDVLDLQENDFLSLPIADVVDEDYPPLPYLVSWDQGGYFSPMRPLLGDSRAKMVFTFDRMLRETKFASSMRDLLALLERRYGRPVDTEFTISLPQGATAQLVRIQLLQCRPQASMAEMEGVAIPDVPQERTLFTASRLVPHGRVSDIRYVVYVNPEAYAGLPSSSQKAEIARVVGRLNQRLSGEAFILVGPGRWGSSNMELGVKVSYADIYNAKMLVELGVSGTESSPEVSYGTHFFQDLVETQIYPLALFPDAPGTAFNADFFQESMNSLAELLPADAKWGDVVRVIDVPALTDGKRLDVVMNSDEEMAVGFLR
jgi:hypothetical protein